MKNRLLQLFILFTISFNSFAQSPESFNYQAVIRDASNTIVSNQAVGIQFRLLQGSPAGTAVYTETHNPTTDDYGLVALAIGTGTTSDDFSIIDWSNGPYFLEIAADVAGGTTYSVLGTQQLMSVPYALYAKTSGTSSSKDEITDTDNDTKIQVEETADEDIIRFDLEGEEMLRLRRTGFGDLLIELPGNGTNTFMGAESGLNSTAGKNTYYGYQAGKLNTTGIKNVVIGHEAGEANQTGSENVYLGRGSALLNSSGNNNLMLGAESGRSSSGSGNVFLGWSSGYNETGNNKLYVENTNSAFPLIYGEFDNDLLRINGTLNINNAFSFPTTDGTANQMLQTDGSGSVTWQDVSVSSVIITDADNDTKIQVEETADEDIIRFDMAGIQQMVLQQNANGDAQLVLGATTNVFIGKSNIGLNNVGTANTFVGNTAGNSNTSGTSNTFFGYQAGKSNTTGVNNLFIGRSAGNQNTSGSQNSYFGKNAGYFSNGSGNVFLGHRAGQEDTGDNKLYIANAAGAPLIYGEFDNELLRVNGTLNINNAFSFPTTDGTANQMLQTDGSGNVTWITPTPTVDTIVNTSATNSETTGQAASIDITGQLEVSGEFQTFGTVKLGGAGDPTPPTITIGSSGTALSDIIKVTKNINLPHISSNGVLHQTVTVTNAKVGATVFVSPASQLSGSVMIGYARVSANNTVEITFLNEGSGGINMLAKDFYITVIQ